MRWNAKQNMQTDSTRSKSLELQIQSRVTSELEKLEASTSETLKSLHDKISSEPESSSSPSGDSAESQDSPSLREKITDALTPSSTLEQRKKEANMSSSSVSAEIDALKKKLEQRRKVEKGDEQVEKAKEELVTCLRLNDRRPLDCWKEVETFKREVGRLERQFVERTVR
jgi:MICOS complex subunit MIC19